MGSEEAIKQVQFVIVNGYGHFHPDHSIQGKHT